MSVTSRTIVGFKKTTKFFFDLEVVVDLNNLPNKGMSPNNGTFLSDSCTSSLIKPPKTIISLSSTITAVLISLLFVAISEAPINRGPNTLDTSCSISNRMEFPSLICGLTSNLTPTSSLLTVLKGFVLSAPKDSPVVIGISWPTMIEDSSLSIVRIEGVDNTLESVSLRRTFKIAAKLFSSFLYFPTPAANPSKVNSDCAAVGIEDEPDVVS